MARKRFSATQSTTAARRAPASSKAPSKSTTGKATTFPGGFSQLINRAIRSGRLTQAGPAAQRLYSYLTYFAEPGDGFRFQVGVATLARLTGMARPTVRGGIDALAAHGLLATDTPATEGTDGQGIPAIYRLLVPDDAVVADPALVYSAPAPGSAADQPPGAPRTAKPVTRAPAGGRATDHKQEQRKSDNKQSRSTKRSAELAESVVLLQGEGVADEAALEFARLDPLHIRAVILTAHEKPGVRDTAAYVVKFLRMGWKPSPKMLARARELRDAPQRMAQAERARKAELQDLHAERERISAERSDVEGQLMGLTEDELDLLFDQLLEDAGDLAKIYRRTGIKHPATRAAMARKLAGA